MSSSCRTWTRTPVPALRSEQGADRPGQRPRPELRGCSRVSLPRRPIGRGGARAAGRTNYLANLGTHANQSDGYGAAAKLSTQLGMFSTGSRVRTLDVTDGTSSTAMFAEVRRGVPGERQVKRHPRPPPGTPPLRPTRSRRPARTPPPFGPQRLPPRAMPAVAPPKAKTGLQYFGAIRTRSTTPIPFRQTMSAGTA